MRSSFFIKFGSIGNQKFKDFSMFRILKWLLTRVFGPIVIWYLKKDRTYKYKGISILIKKGVFHPGFFFSTKFLLNTIDKEDAKNKKFLELGAGSGLISFYFAKKGANVFSSDLNQKAIEGLAYNKVNLNANIQVIASDLFDNIPRQTFDFIVVNPPFYPKDPQNKEEIAWFCGAEFQYFHKLFSQIGDYMNHDTKVFMVLSEDCKIDKIIEIAQINGLRFVLFEKKRIIGELNYIYQIFKN